MMNRYVYGNSIFTGGEMHVIWMRYHMTENKNFSQWLQTQQKIS